jgi:hypothetical protein
MTIYAAASGEWLTGVASNVARLARVATSGDDSTPNDHIRASGITWTIEAFPTRTNAVNAACYLATGRFGKALRGRAKSSMTRKGSGVRVPHGPPDALVRGGAGTEMTAAAACSDTPAILPQPSKGRHLLGEAMGSTSRARPWIPLPEPMTSTYRPRKPLPRERLSTAQSAATRPVSAASTRPVHDDPGVAEMWWPV